MPNRSIWYPSWQTFSTLPRHGNKFVEQRTRSPRNSTPSHSDLDLLLEQITNSPVSERGKRCRKLLDSFQQKHLRKLALEANKRLDSCTDQTKRWFDLIVDTFFTKIFKEEPPKKLKSRPKYIYPYILIIKVFSFSGWALFCMMKISNPNFLISFEKMTAQLLSSTWPTPFETKSLTIRIPSATSTWMIQNLMEQVFARAIVHPQTV